MYPGTSHLPKAHVLNQRAMEIFREVGVDMNFAILFRFNNVSGDRATTIKELATVIRRKRIPGLNETTYYLSATNPEKIYALQLMYTLDTLPCDKKDQKELVYSKLNSPDQPEELLIFKLDWDYRRLDLIPTLSALRMVSFPLKCSQERISEAMKVLKQHSRQFSGLAGIWVGYSYDPKPTIGESEKLRCLIRTDWLSQEAYFDFINSTAVQDIMHRSTTYSTEFSYAIGQIIDIYRPDTLIESNQNDSI